jgi:cytochrome P450
VVSIRAGAQLARIELQMPFPALLDRFPTLRIAVPVEYLAIPVDSLRGSEYLISSGLVELPVMW